MEKKKGYQPIINKRARYEYTVLESLEAGIELTGAEVKSLRAGAASLLDSYVALTSRGPTLLNAMISPYKFARNEDYEPKRSRRLLLKRSEIEKLRGKAEQKGVSLVPLRIYLKHNRFKVEVGLVRGKKQYEKREQIKKRDLRREMEGEYRGAKYRG